MATTRINIRLNEDIKVKAQKASALLGKSLSAYVTNLIIRDATRIIAQHESMTVRDDIFDRFMDACAEVSKPNKALSDAVTFTKKQGIK